MSTMHRSDDAAEIEAVRRTENEIHRAPRPLSKFKGNTSGERSSPGEVVYSAGQKAQWILFCGSLFPWAEKDPFTKSGESTRGAIEVSGDKEEIKCHVCGQWKANLTGRHLRMHKISTEDYHLQHGLERSTALISPNLRQRMADNTRKSIARGVSNLIPFTSEQSIAWHRQRKAPRFPGGYSAEWANFKMNCHAQYTDRIPCLAIKLGHCPTRKELRKGDEHGAIHAETVEYVFNMKLREVFKALGLIPNKGGDQRIAAPTELKILQLRAKGFSYREIAHRLTVSPSTVMKYSRTDREGKSASQPSSESS